MSFVSYAMNFEDVILERVFKDKKDGFYVDVGAADPTIDSLTRHFYDKGWRGINIEPSDCLFQKLQRERERDINLNVAITQISGKITLYDVPNSGLSSIYESNVKKINHGTQCDYQGRLVEPYRETIVQTLPLKSVLHKYAVICDIDFLKIDVEGAEKDVLLSNDWERFRPKILIIESTKPNSPETNYEDWEGIVVAADYVFVYFDGLNRFYLRSDLLSWKHYFASPPCVFDKFVPYKQQRMENQISQFEARAQHATERAAQAEATAHEATERAAQAEATAHEATERAAQAEFSLQALLSSTSWRITAPLRRGATFFKKATKAVLRNVIRTARKIYPLRIFGNRLLRRFPVLRVHLSRIYNRFNIHRSMNTQRQDFPYLLPVEPEDEKYIPNKLRVNSIAEKDVNQVTINEIILKIRNEYEKRNPHGNKPVDLFDIMMGKIRNEYYGKS